MPSRSGVRASPAARSAPPSMKNISMPMLNTNIVRRNGSASARTSGVACTSSSSHGDSSSRAAPARTAPMTDGGEERLIDRAVHPVGLVGAGEARHQHAHAGEQRADEDDDDEEDLPAHADRGVAGEADVVPDHRVIDDPLQAADGVLQDRRPGELPDGVGDRALRRSSGRNGGRAARQEALTTPEHRFCSRRRGHRQISRQEGRS